MRMGGRRGGRGRGRGNPRIRREGDGEGVPDFVSQLWRKSCETKSRTESLGLRLVSSTTFLLKTGRAWEQG